MTWTPKPLGEILDQSGRHRAGDRDLPVLSITMKHGLVDQADKFKKRVASSDTSNYRIAYQNELVVGFPIDEGVLGFQTKYPAGIVSPAYDIWKLKNDAECHIPYLERYLRSPQARSLYASRMQGAVARRRSLTKADFLNIEIPFPSLDDQIRIAHLLGKVEGLIAQRKQHLQQLDDLLKSVFLEMFGDPVRNDKGWDKPELNVFGKISTGNTPPRNDLANYDEDFIEWVKTDNITGDSVFVTPSTEHLSEVGARKARTVTNGALLVACIAGSVESIGRVALTDRTVSFNQQINAVQPGNDVNSLYLYALFKLCRVYIQSHATKGMKKILTKGDFGKITMIKPPSEIQNQFATIVEKIESLKYSYQHSLNDLKNFYGALSQQAFKGELDLSRVPLPEQALHDKRSGDIAEIDQELAQGAENNVPSAIPPFGALDEYPMSTQEGRKKMLRAFFDAFLGGLNGDDAFSLDAFWQEVHFKSVDYMGEDDEHFGQLEYDLVKDWVFDEIASGRLAQYFDDPSNRVALRKAG